MESVLFGNLKTGGLSLANRVVVKLEMLKLQSRMDISDYIFKVVFDTDLTETLKQCFYIPVRN